MAKNISIEKSLTPAIAQPSITTAKKNALQERNWAVLTACAGFAIAVAASFAVTISTLSVNLALAVMALLMAVAQAWLIFGLLQYRKVTWWASLMFIWCFWLFGLPCLLLNILPPMYNAYGYVLFVVSLAPFAMLVWQRNRFQQ